MRPASKRTAVAQKNAPAGLGNPIRRTSRRHAGIAIAGDATAAPPTGRTGADADVNGNSEHVTGSGEFVTAGAKPQGRCGMSSATQADIARYTSEKLSRTERSNLTALRDALRRIGEVRIGFDDSRRNRTTAMISIVMYERPIAPHRLAEAITLALDGKDAQFAAWAKGAQS